MKGTDRREKEENRSRDYRRRTLLRIGGFTDQLVRLSHLRAGVLRILRTRSR